MIAHKYHVEFVAIVLESSGEFLFSGVARNRRLCIVTTHFNKARTICPFLFGVLNGPNFLGPASLTRINFHPSVDK